LPTLGTVANKNLERALGGPYIEDESATCRFSFHLFNTRPGASHSRPFSLFFKDLN
jgi:hypothetical protein